MTDGTIQQPEDPNATGTEMRTLGSGSTGGDGLTILMTFNGDSLLFTGSITQISDGEAEQLSYDQKGQAEVAQGSNALLAEAAMLNMDALSYGKLRLEIGFDPGDGNFRRAICVLDENPQKLTHCVSHLVAQVAKHHLSTAT